MVTPFDDARDQIELYNIIVGGGITQKYALEVVLVQFAPSNTRVFNKHSQTKHFQMGKMRFYSKVAFKGSFMCHLMN
jgi:hypothetical protein